MTGKERADELRRILAGISEKRIIFLAATGTMDDASERIWTRGEMTDGSKLTYNEDYSLYAYAPPAPRKPSGKGKTGDKIKGGYYTSYNAGFKADMGRKDFYYELTGDLRQDWLGGASPRPTEISPLEVVITLTDKNARKAEGLAKSKGEFLKFNEDERQAFVDRVRRFYQRDVLGR